MLWSHCQAQAREEAVGGSSGSPRSGAETLVLRPGVPCLQPYDVTARGHPACSCIRRPQGLDPDLCSAHCPTQPCPTYTHVVLVRAFPWLGSPLGVCGSHGEAGHPGTVRELIPTEQATGLGMKDWGLHSAPPGLRGNLVHSHVHTHTCVNIHENAHIDTHAGKRPNTYI